MRKHIANLTTIIGFLFILLTVGCGSSNIMYTILFAIIGTVNWAVAGYLFEVEEDEKENM